MGILAKATTVLALLPVVLGSRAVISDQALAETVISTGATTQVNLSDNGVVDISGGTQSAGNLFHSFQQFSLESQQTANFIVTATTDAIIGQVTGGTTSNIDGLLKVTGSNADLYLVNPTGLLFGPNARLDLGGSFTATTATHLGDGQQWFEVLSNPDDPTLLAPPSNFGFSRPGTIVNQGHLAVSDGHSLRLLGTQVTNLGTLSAPNGEVTLLAAEPGQTMHLGQRGGLLSLEIDPNAHLVDTLPTLITGGDLSHSDTLVVDHNGGITLVQSSPSNPPPASLMNAGAISTQGTTGGEINLLGNTIQVTESTLNASGNSGGVIRIGGDYQGQGGLPAATHTHIAATTSLIADGVQGDGGQVIVWSDGITLFDGTISAQSAIGDGGLVETSGLNHLSIGEQATVTTAAPYGDNGLWLIDPTELTVVDIGGIGVISVDDNDPISSTINASTIVSALDNNNVTLQATETINVNAVIDASGNSINSSLLLDTATLNLNERITLQGSGQLSGTANTVNVGINGSVQNGVDAVTDGGTVNLAATTYRERNTITLDHALTLVGQGQNITVISGDVDNDGTGDHQVLQITSGGDNITLTGLTIRDGLSTSAGAGLENDGDNVLISDTSFFNNEVSSSFADGGAIHNRGSLTLLNTTFQENRSGSDGGAIDILQGSVEITNSYFGNNQANGHGGAIDLDPNGSLIISDTLFEFNTATDGAAIYLEGNVRLDSTELWTNTASMDGGGIFQNSGTLHITNSDLFDNQAENGGAIALNGTSTLRLDNTLFELNAATNQGGGIFQNNGMVTINDSYFLENTAENGGGGIHNNFSDNVVISGTNFIANQALNASGGGINNLGNITLTNSDLEGNAASFGGGIFNGASSVLTVTNGEFTSNQATNDGGGLYNNRGEILITNSGFESNNANRGGGLFNDGAATLNTVNFSANGAASDGGGLYNQFNAVSNISSGVFVENSAHTGGGIYNRGAANLLNSVILGNQATGLGSQNGGAGVFNTFGGILVVDDSLIANNTSASQGGGILNLATTTAQEGGIFNLASTEQTVVAISNSSIVGNQAATEGGGIANASDNDSQNLAELTITNSTISNNQAVTGGGIGTIGSTTLTNVTIAENIATSSGGGIVATSSTASIPELINTIVANNQAPTNPDVQGQFIDQGNNLIGIDQGSMGFNASTLVGTARNPLDPNLTALNNNLGLFSHQLLPGSPAANAGNDSVATTHDQHGQSRIVGGTVDIGAVESDILPDTTTILVSSMDPDPLDPGTVDPTAIDPPLSDPPESPSAPNAPTSPAPSTTTLSPSDDLADMELVALTNGSILRQETKSDQAFQAEQESTALTLPNGRLRYFDEEAFQYLEDSFSQAYEQYWQLPQTTPVTLPSVQAILQEANQAYQTEAAVIYATFVPPTSPTDDSGNRVVLPRTQQTPTPNDQLLLLLVLPTGEPVQYLMDVSRTEITRQAKLFRLAVSDPEDPLSYKALARQMYDWLLNPLRQDLAEHHIDHVLYSLDQGLRTIPLAAMMQEDTYIIEQYGVSVIPSMGLTQLQFGNVAPKPKPLIAGAHHFQAFEDLPAVPIELDVVAKNLQANDVLLDEAFTIENLLHLQTSQQPNLLHLATHAEFNAGNLDQSFIQLWDSSLTFHQMQQLSWPELELLILSACNTAMSSPNAELGFIGLAAAAGIETSMGSLWNVSDIGTLALMAEFYTQLPSTPVRSESLQQAQLSLLRGDTHINNNLLITSQGGRLLPEEWGLPTRADFSHPFYWAGFTMVGNPWH